MKTGVAACCSVQKHEHVAFELPDAAPRMGSRGYRRKQDDRGEICASRWRSSVSPSLLFVTCPH